MKKETATEAFLRQTDIDPNDIKQSELDEQLYGRADIGFLGIGRIERKLDIKAQSAAMNGSLSYSRPLEGVNYGFKRPTRLKDGELDQVTEEHPHLKGYDHSLDLKSRNKIIGLKSGDPIDMGDMGSG